MSFQLPTTAGEWLPLLVPLAAIAIGLTYFLSPRSAFSLIGLEGSQRHPDAAGQARAGMAGLPLGTGISCILFGQPLLLMVLGLAFALTALGKVVHIVVDGARMMLVLARLVLAVLLAVFALYQTGIEPPQFVVPPSQAGWAIAAVAAITAGIGAVSALMPARMLDLMRLARSQDRPAAHGELRGLFSGFHIALGLSVLAYGGIFLHLTLGIGWACVAFGRMIHMLSDRANDGYNWLLLVFNLSMAAVPLAIVFGAV